MKLETPPELLSRSEAESIAQEVLSRVTTALPGVRAAVTVDDETSDIARFARNDVLEVSGRQTLEIDLRLEINGRRAWAITDQRDAEGLAALIARVSATEQNHGDRVPIELPAPKPFTDPEIYFDATLSARAPTLQGDLVRRAAEMTERADGIGAGTLEITAYSRVLANTAGLNGYSRGTYGEYHVNARTRSGQGSGWAWGGGEDFSRIDAIAITQRAIDLARRSESPVAVEPGHYTVILEPEAVAQFIGSIFGEPGRFLSAEAADGGLSVFSRFEDKKVAGNKLGLQMTDRRVQLFSDPMDPHMPFSPLNAYTWDNRGSITPRVTWIENGVLENLAYRASYAREQNRPVVTNPLRGSLEIDGPAQTLDEMIAQTRRGILVHRFSGLALVDPLSMLMTGVTRDGTFLIENGTVTRPIKNMRFSESPFFILNKIEAAGPTARASSSVACPRLKVHDFEFTSLSDAI